MHGVEVWIWGDVIARVVSLVSTHQASKQHSRCDVCSARLEWDGCAFLCCTHCHKKKASCTNGSIPRIRTWKYVSYFPPSTFAELICGTTRIWLRMCFWGRRGSPSRSFETATSTKPGKDRTEDGVFFYSEVSESFSFLILDSLNSSDFHTPQTLFNGTLLTLFIGFYYILFVIGRCILKMGFKYKSWFIVR